MSRRGWSPVAAMLPALSAACVEAREAPPQPLPFNHAIHVQVELADRKLACTDCHPGAERGSHAGLPPLQHCLRCHMRPQGDPPSEGERQVRVAAAAGGPFRWIQVTRNPGHVYFSHGAHVTRAELGCVDCHGDVSRWTEPPRTPDLALMSMSRCLKCHHERGAPFTCSTCHQ